MRRRLSRVGLRRAPQPTRGLQATADGLGHVGDPMQVVRVGCRMFASNGTTRPAEEDPRAPCRFWQRTISPLAAENVAVSSAEPHRGEDGAAAAVLDGPASGPSTGVQALPAAQPESGRTSGNDLDDLPQSEGIEGAFDGMDLAVVGSFGPVEARRELTNLTA